MDKHKIIENFIKNFILKDKRERCAFELMNVKKRSLFVNKLNHNWETVIDMRKLKSIPKNCDVYSSIKMNLKIKDNDQVYLISNYDDADDKLMVFEQAFNKINSRGLATIILSIKADKIYVETEQIQGPSEKFIGTI